MSEMPGRIGIEYTCSSASQGRGIELQEIREFASEVFGTATNLPVLWLGAWDLSVPLKYLLIGGPCALSPSQKASLIARMSSPAETFNSGLASYCGRSRKSDASGTRTIDEQILRRGHFAFCAPKSTRGQAIF